MKHKLGKWKFILIPIGIAACVTAVGFLVMTLWNNLLPEILNVKTITFWQAIGIFALCKILFGFGGKGGGPGKGAWMRNRLANRFKNMSQDERDAFRTQWEERCGWKGRGFGKGHFGKEQPDRFGERVSPAQPSSAEENINPS